MSIDELRNGTLSKSILAKHKTDEPESGFYDYDRDYYISYDQVKEIKSKTTEMFSNWMKILNIDSYVDHQHTKDTPERLSRMYVDELLSFAYTPTPKLTTFKNINGSNLVKLDNVEINSLCAHHFVPFIGTAEISYIPNEKIVGLSKLPRLCRYFARKPSIQEELTIETIEYLNKILNPIAIFYKITAVHLCMKIRGVKSNATTTTSKFLGDKTYYDLLVKGG
ncbi:MAG: GTP cyclohydrolase I [Candidatus Micrarchaeaceae archaeon]